MDSVTLENVYISKTSHDKLQPHEGVPVAVTENEVTENEVLEVLEDQDGQLANEVTAKQQQIDKMTLELLVNKRQYRKYLERHNTVEYEQKQDNYIRFCKYKKEIGVLLRDLLNDYSVSGNSMHLGNTEIQEIFEAFIQKSTYFFETKDHDTPSPRGQGDDLYNDTDTLFGSITDTDTDTTRSNEFATSTTLITYEGKPSDAQRVIPRTPTLRSGVLPIRNRQNRFAIEDESYTANASRFRLGNSFWGENIVKRNNIRR